jgi:hypothetical protein
MSSLTHSREEGRYAGGSHGWSTQHPYFATIAVMLAAIVCGVLVGILFNLVMSGAEPASVHRGGGAARAAAIHRVHSGEGTGARADRLAGAAATTSGHDPARGGLAAGRSYAATGDVQP